MAITARFNREARSVEIGRREKDGSFTLIEELSLTDAKVLAKTLNTGVHTLDRSR